MTYFQALVIGAVQGITELFPISSLGHSVILPSLFGWNIDQSNPLFLTFLVATHLATALVLFFYFIGDWMLILKGMWVSFTARAIGAGGAYGKLGWLLLVATIPAGIFGVLFQDSLRALFASPQIVAGVLIVNGLMLFGADALRRHRGRPENNTSEASDERAARLSWWQAVKVGCMQVLALIPGFSRTGATITGGLASGLSYEDAARFSFLLATPIIGAAALLEIPSLFTTPSESMFIGQTLVGAVAAGIFAYLSTRFLLHYFETKKLWPFAVYCVAIGIVMSLIFFVRG